MTFSEHSDAQGLAGQWAAALPELIYFYDQESMLGIIEAIRFPYPYHYPFLSLESQY